MKSVGIDLGSSSIKVVEVSSTSKGAEIVSYDEYNLDLNPAKDNQLLIIEFLRDLSLRFDSSTHIVFGLTQDKVAIRRKIFPFNERLKILKSLPFELEDDIPFSSDNAIFDSKVVRVIGNQTEVLACATPVSHVESILNFCEDSHISPYLISCDGIAFANVIENWNEPPQNLPETLDFNTESSTERKINLIINFGHTKTLISAFEDQYLVGTRTILWGGKNIADAISKKYSIPFVEAVKELKSKAFVLLSKQGASFDQIAFSEVIGSTIKEVAREIQLTILEFKSELNATVFKIDITGGTSGIQNLSPYLTQLLDIPVNKFNFLDRYERSNHSSALRNDPVNNSKFSIAYGLAIEGLKRPRNPALNFLRGQFAQKNQKLIEFMGKWGTTLRVAGAAFLILLIYSMMRSSISSNASELANSALKTHAKSIARLTGKNASDSKIQSYIRNNKKRGYELKLLSQVIAMNSALDILKKISDAMPPKNVITLDVKNISILDDAVLIEGYAKQESEILQIVQSLNKVSASGKALRKPSSLPTIANATSFAVALKVDRGIAKVKE